MNVRAEPQTHIKFKCSYDHSAKLYIYYKLTPLNGMPVTAWATEPDPLNRTMLGASRVWNVYMGEHACNVECHFLDGNGRELALIVTTITPGLTRTV